MLRKYILTAESTEGLRREPLRIQYCIFSAALCVLFSLRSLRLFAVLLPCVKVIY